MLTIWKIRLDTVDAQVIEVPAGAPALAKAIDAGAVATAVVTHSARVLAGRIKTEPKITVRWSE